MAFLERLAPAYGDDWWFQSALAFTYHEVDRYEESRSLSERSLAQYPGNANASHNLAHIHFETLDTDAGVAFLAEWMTGYDRRRRSTATSPGTWPCSSCTGAPTRGPRRSSSATSCPRSIRGWP